MPGEKTERSEPQVFQYRDPSELSQVDAGTFQTDFSGGVILEGSGKARRFKRYPPSFHDDPDDVGLFAGFAAETIKYPPVFAAAARSARVVGFRTVLSDDGFFFNDDLLPGLRRRRRFLADLASPDPLNEETGLRRSGAFDHFALDPGTKQTENIAGLTILLSSEEPSNYGSFLFRVLPKLYTVSSLKLHLPARYLVWAGYPTFREYLHLLGIPEDRIVDHDPQNRIYRLEQLLVPSLRNNQAYLDPESVNLFAGLRDRFGQPRKPGTKIYVSRITHSQNGSMRVMRNEAELVHRLAGVGFLIVSPELLSVAEQIRVFSSAEMVVGPSGSGMFNVVHCHPGTKVIDIESEPHWIHAHQNLFASCALRYGIFVGNAEDRDFERHHKPWTVNIGALLSRIQSFSQS